jgi:hypothetical protein
MKTTVAKHNTTGNLHNVQIYTTFVYFIDRMDQISINEFNEFFTIVL